MNSSKELSAAQGILQEYRIINNLYLLGSLAQGLTIFDQQVRAHNLAWALWRVQKDHGAHSQGAKIAVVGGGIAGLTLTACLLSRMPKCKITLFEKRWDICPLQQGSDTRWVHPHIYRWPEHGSRAPDAGIPVLNWTEGRASDVSREILEGFGKYADRYGVGDTIELYLGLSHLKIEASTHYIEWMGRKGERNGAYVRSAEPYGDRRCFDQIVIATGFGLEEGAEEMEGVNSYWRNDRLGQPQLSGDKATYLVSGFGDGALVDLCRLTIERFRQDTILYELFEHDLEQIEKQLRASLGDDFGRTSKNVYETIESLPNPFPQIMEKARRNLLIRLRKDTFVVLHAGGKEGNTVSLKTLFGPHSSFLNRTLLYLLYKCGGFVLSLGRLDEAVRDSKVSEKNIIKRHGADSLRAICTLFNDQSFIEPKLREMKESGQQAARRHWPLGSFPYLMISN